jgi:circadian clock protein KaiB
MRPQKPKSKEYVLRLYVAGTTSKSIRAVSNIKEICESSLKNRYDLEVIDIYQQPVLTKGEQIIAAPTLVNCRYLCGNSLATCLIPNGYL